MTGWTPSPRPPSRPRAAVRLPALFVAVAALLLWALLSAGATPASGAPGAAPPAADSVKPRARKCPRHFPDCAIGPAAEAVALAMLATSDSPLDTVYLYAEAGDGWQRGRIYDVHEDRLQPRPMTPAIASTVEHLWQVPAVERRWTSVEIIVADGRFSIDLAYDEPPPPARQTINRRADAKAAAQYPGKPIRGARERFEPPPADEEEDALGKS